MAANPGPVATHDQIVQYTAVPKYDQYGHGPNNKGGNPPPAPLRRFPIRSLFLIIIPPLLAAYFVIVQTMLASPDPDTAPYGHRNATWVFYSWFLLGVWGLSMSNYGLQGVEAAMLERRFWAPRNSHVLSMHAEGTWTSLGGWITLAKAVIRREGKPSQLVGRLWVLLAALSLAMYIALPLSGLAMELKDGYVKASGHPEVLGHNWLNYNDRQPQTELPRAKAAWLGGAPMTLPGASIIYSNSDTNRAEHESLKGLPNSLPMEGGLLDVFLAPQAENPVQGNAWGLRLGYKCDLVKSKSEFTILSQRSSDLYQSSPSGFRTRFKPADNTFFTRNNQTITFWNSSNPPYAGNTWAYGETGQIPLPGVDVPGNVPWRNASTFDDEGLHVAGSLLEIALWQLRTTASYENEVEYTFNETMEPTIGDMGSPFFLDQNNRFALNESFFPKKVHLDGEDKFNVSAIADAPEYATFVRADNIVTISPPIGLRCLYQYETGYADLNPESTTFTSFTATPRPKPGAVNTSPPFGVITEQILNQTYYDLYAADNGATSQFYSNSLIYTSFVRPEMLLGSVMRAFAMDALELMYDGANSFNGAYEHENLTSTKVGRILGPGEVPMLLPTILFCIWAVGCVVIGVIYGFQRRRAETLSADLAEDIRRGMPSSAGIMSNTTR
ncbi:hypothetical protein AJ80_06915 [Polytolypa hystricis UAMH7299]|uniref:Uncharacterized protein n=1 Tax=Polytolypa hystricis (strain UAMH7299) TaxID=1447883 RepID=A0A2B7XSI8_POLH7|nr:hypothetical protein AJ80_06915 [Polytolypa hystricis UAMH7299]